MSSFASCRRHLNNLKLAGTCCATSNREAGNPPKNKHSKLVHFGTSGDVWPCHKLLFDHWVVFHEKSQLCSSHILSSIEVSEDSLMAEPNPLGQRKCCFTCCWQIAAVMCNEWRTDICHASNSTENVHFTCHWRQQELFRFVAAKCCCNEQPEQTNLLNDHS